jgi:uncharacterized phage protein gp47/JayE
MAGVESTGFVLKTFDEIRTSVSAQLRSKLGASLNLTPESNFGKLVDVFCDGLAEAWETMEDVYTAFTPDGASGDALIELAALTATNQLGATRSTVVATLGGTPSTVIPAGSQASVTGTGARFRTLADATIGGGGTVSANLEAVDTGPATAYAGTLTVIETAVSGWATITNPADAELGRNLESTPALRQRRETELRALGGGSLPAIVAELRKVTGVTSVAGFENTTDSTDANGLPPHSVEVVVAGGADADVRGAIFRKKAAGIGTYASGTVIVTGSVTDAEGITHIIKFSRPAQLPVYEILELTVKRGVFPLDGIALVQEAVADWGDANLGTGTDVVGSVQVPTILAAVPGIVDVSAIRIGLADPPSSTARMVVTPRQQATFDTTRIAVHITYDEET